MGSAPTVTGECVQAPLQCLTPAGELAAPLPPGLDANRLVEIYRWMVRLRAFDSRALRLQRQGRLGTYAPYSGQEACQVCSVLPLQRTDWICPTYRDHGAMMVHGVPMANILRYWRGDEWGSHLPGVYTLPISIPIATQCLHAVGLAWAARLRGTGQVAVAYFGDGATSQGDFHEAMNFAGVFRLPVIFFCQNNLYAISVPLARQTAAPIVTKAAGYGVAALRVDGNDPIAVWAAVSQAAARARAGEGATLIEALTYRYGPHTTADDPTRYRSEDEVRQWQERDPITRLHRYLVHQGLWDAASEEALQEQVKAEVAAAVAEAESLHPAPTDIFDYVYGEAPWYIREQRREVLAEARVGEGGGHG
ncbi:pyruvate dehydrogenase (acetyl-transferring) E1 component subunit alpha [Caldinitratiruptor microaerophilus]|uniref:Pyruvate dehydrogenase E1 component subunit alpha n=1 Tax=Caldinitratiruptor microaerophilus TaxID=671077 RepID=A0AA35G6J3_9FIRM|nr:pyruvate dehydrogenase (acetyl-transferring) E1 component subunit alpha [Caldinitratiruptor microaerophilus]BDG59046.1 pyruvate dehydrogenase (acetyl-transferring) E1 component subunit alpha [Caldinitratiruptor microaerophilus]